MSTGYARRLGKHLTEVYEKKSLRQEREFSQLRLVILSDLHKGQRDGADDFEQCEPVYLSALDHYWQQDFELFLLGDIEELWECRPRPVIAAYDNVLMAEQRFAAAENPARYLRLVGNHDDLWYSPDAVAEHLQEFLAGRPVWEGIRLGIMAQNRKLGELFLVHGHQGTFFSDRLREISELAVRYIWRPIQRLFRFKSTTPSNNFQLKREHELAMYAWAAADRGRVLIAGHTHHPVWAGEGFEQALERHRQQAAVNLEAERPWIQTQVGGRIELPGQRPCYFNTGCCCFSDGTITGIEIEAGQMRLVRWKEPDAPRRELLFTTGLEDILRAVA